MKAICNTKQHTNLTYNKIYDVEFPSDKSEYFIVMDDEGKPQKYPKGDFLILSTVSWIPV